MRKLKRKSKPRRQMLKNLAMSLILYERITTTSAKGKEVRSIVEKSINAAKEKNLASRRKLLSFFLHNKNVVNKLTSDLPDRFADKTSGYIRIFKTKSRLGDNAPMVILILSKSKFLKNLNNKDEKTNK